ncbi:DUF350 domain-containing protein [Aureimonas glaciei]|uniref:DUF350 domain-containing protein n=1 Tax=Aureimonas glaciei TaxID=1776957 RepID=A0A917DIG1_9HYPH|nr:DUF350 domain-containing protein [Aureimonas glaciei]GGD40362.1 DUF350 domain-containing protein [Aureimonas glaciei]
MFGYVAGLPAFLAYFATGLAALALFAVAYSAATPHHELRLIRTGNAAAVVAFLGAILGFSLPLASAAANSVSIIDFLIWAVVGGLVQGVAFLLASLTMSGLPARITAGEMAGGTWAAGIAVAVGMLNAACMTY